MSNFSSEIERLDDPFQGEVFVSYQTLLAAFGPPVTVEKEKTQVEWKVESAGITATISDWRFKGVPPHNLGRWAVKGEGKESYLLVRRLLGK